MNSPICALISQVVCCQRPPLHKKDAEIAPSTLHSHYLISYDRSYILMLSFHILLCLPSRRFTTYISQYACRTFCLCIIVSLWEFVSRVMVESVSLVVNSYVYSLFNDDFSTAYVIQRRISGWLLMIRGKAVTAYFKITSQHFPGSSEQNLENLRQYSRLPRMII
jgi:hypothetical protein